MGTGNVTAQEVRAAAYRYASRVADRPWDVGAVKRGEQPFRRFLEEARGDRTDFELRVEALEMQTLNLGLHPWTWNPAVMKEKHWPVRPEVPDKLPHPEDVVRDARKIFEYIQAR